jgi:hypothetical protein
MLNIIATQNTLDGLQFQNSGSSDPLIADREENQSIFKRQTTIRLNTFKWVIKFPYQNKGKIPPSPYRNIFPGVQKNLQRSVCNTSVCDYNYIINAFAFKKAFCHESFMQRKIIF